MNLFEAILNVQREVGYIQKRGINKQLGYKFAKAEDIIGAIRESALKNNLLISVSYNSAEDLPPVENNGKTIYRAKVELIVKLKFLISLTDPNNILRYDTQESVHVFWGIGHAFDDKALPKAETMALKSALRRLFLIETGEDDPDKETVEEAPSDIHSKLMALPQDFKDYCKANKFTRGQIIQIMESINWNHNKINAVIVEKW